MERKNKTTTEFFASANSYSGFKSYFDEIFDSRKFDRIFVLKGGPGSGKSTLMKKISRQFENEETDVELFRCSSDKNSLDGIILKNGERRIAIIDGTAPHERDAVIPGAVDVLINLGDAFDTDALYSSKKEIFELNFCKKQSYKIAYDNLTKSSVFSNNIKAEMINLLNMDAVNSSVEEIAKSLNLTYEGENCTRLFSSFSKDGYTKIKSFDSSEYKIYTVNGRFGSDCAFLNSLEKFFRKNGYLFTKMPSALDENVTEGIYFPRSKLAILCADYGDCLCNTEEFLSTDDGLAFEKIKTLQIGKELYENAAKEALNKASECHFELERIYTGAVDFEIIDKYTQNVTDSIAKIFS